MAKKIEQVDFSKVAKRVIKTPLEDFVEDSYLPYAHYVIRSRALISDDGLKPVQRRILYAMDQLGLTDKKDYMKAAKIVGETMGNYHPHGDSSIGDALSRLGQKFSMRVPLVDVQGSVGFTTGDPAAAPRYWEGRPTLAAMELTRELKEGSVEMGLNYDGKYAEPTMLPIRWPNGLINGSQGIAVGYSANIFPHNPTEVMDAVLALIDNPELTIKDVLKIMPGPDMPTGGVLKGYEGVKEYYETGKGSFSVRGRYTIEPGTRGTNTVVFSEAPYQVSAEQIIKAIQDGKKKDKFKEVSYAKDLSDKRNGFQLHIGIKAGANPAVVLKDIFKWTPLEQTFSANMNVLKDGVPVVRSMVELLQDFIDFRSECISKKSAFKVAKLEKQIEKLKGIVAVLVDINKAVKIISKSENEQVANAELMKAFKINEEQAEHILSMPLRRLTKADSSSLQMQIDSFQEEHDYLQLVLTDEKVFKEFLIKELKETREIIKDKRRTDILKKAEPAPSLKADNSKVSYVTFFADDYITRTVEPFDEKDSSPILTQMKVNTDEGLVFIQKNGEGFKMPASYLPLDTIVPIEKATGLPANSVVGVGKETPGKDDVGLFVSTLKGGVNIINGTYPNSNEFTATKLADDDEVYSASWVDKEAFDNKKLVMVSSDAFVINFPLNQVRTSNPGAGTVRGIGLTEDANLAGVSIANDDDVIVSCTFESVKTTNLTEIPSRNRGAKGVALQKLKDEDEVIATTTGKLENILAMKNGRKFSLPKPTERIGKVTKKSGLDVMLGFAKI